jgi:hypothetical protein
MSLGRRTGGIGPIMSSAYKTQYSTYCRRSRGSRPCHTGGATTRRQSRLQHSRRPSRAGPGHRCHLPAAVPLPAADGTAGAAACATASARAPAAASSRRPPHRWPRQPRRSLPPPSTWRRRRSDRPAAVADPCHDEEGRRGSVSIFGKTIVPFSHCIELLGEALQAQQTI